jgi:hypothetical protein
MSTGASAAATIPGSETPVTSFVCANPPGSNATYAYVGPDKRLYLVHGCAQSGAILAANGRYLSPIAFSPGGAWLLASDIITDNNSAAADFDCLALVNTMTREVTTTALCNPNYVNSGWTQWYVPIAWKNANEFYLATTAGDLSVRVTILAVPSLTQTRITTFTWVAAVENGAAAPSGIELRQNALYYGGYQSKSEGGAWLHRYDLMTGMDTRLVRLGLAGSGGCQVADVPCSWTGPWDVSPDATRLAYHNPGPTQDITDTYIEPGQPLYVSALDGSNAQRLFPSQPLGQGFNQAVFSPDGQYVVAYFPSATPELRGSEVFERLTDGSTKVAPTELSWNAWPAQPGLAVMYNTQTGALELYNVATGARTLLQRGTYDYVWS